MEVPGNTGYLWSGMVMDTGLNGRFPCHPEVEPFDTFSDGFINSLWEIDQKLHRVYCVMIKLTDLNTLSSNQSLLACFFKKF